METWGEEIGGASPLTAFVGVNSAGKNVVEGGLQAIPVFPAALHICGTFVRPWAG